jgi:hypothetical protein
MQSPDSESNAGRIGSRLAVVFAKRRRVWFLALGGLMLVSAIACASYSIHSFYTSLEPRSQVRKMQKDLAELQRQRQSPSGKETAGLEMMFGTLLGVGPLGADLLGSTSLLATENSALMAEKSGYRYLCLTLALGFPAIWLLWLAPNRPAATAN